VPSDPRPNADREIPADIVDTTDAATGRKMTAKGEPPRYSNSP
jgi:hypothetical protein